MAWWGVTEMETWEDYGTYIHFTTDNIRGFEWIKKKKKPTDTWKGLWVPLKPGQK